MLFKRSGPLAFGRVSELKTHAEKQPNLADRDFLARHLAGDRTAFSELVNMYQAQVYTYLVRCGVSAAVRDDLFQEIFISVHKHSSQYDRNFPLGPWLFTIVANKVRDHFRALPKHEILAEEAISEVVDPSPAAEQLQDAQETSKFIEAELKKLPLEQREVLLLSSQKDLDQADISKILNMPIGTVKTNLKRAREKLHLALQRRLLQTQREVQR